MKHTISVEQKHIDAGVKRSPVGCPIALAIKDADLKGWCVSNSTIIRFSEDADYARELPLPVFAAKFSKEFDRGLPVEPLNFEIEV